MSDPENTAKIFKIKATGNDGVQKNFQVKQVKPQVKPQGNANGSRQVLRIQVQPKPSLTKNKVSSLGEVKTGILKFDILSGFNTGAMGKEEWKKVSQYTIGKIDKEFLLKDVNLSNGTTLISNLQVQPNEYLAKGPLDTMYKVLNGNDQKYELTIEYKELTEEIKNKYKNIVCEFLGIKKEETFEIGDMLVTKYDGKDVLFVLRKDDQHLLQSNAGGSNLKKSKQRIQMGGRQLVVYKGPRGGEYIKQKGKFVSLKASVKSK